MPSLRSYSSHENTWPSAYDDIAGEYYDRILHPTCHNFNCLSRLYIQRQLLEPLCDGPVVEVGAGESSVAAILHARGYVLDILEITDASPAMLEYSRQWQAFGATLRVVDARSLDYRDASVPVIVAGLGDAYNAPTFWAEVARVLAPGGRLIFTLPSFEWAARYRQGQGATPIDCAEFKLRDGRTVRVASVVLPLDAQVEMMEGAGLSVTSFEALGESALEAGTLSPKVKVFDGDATSVVWGFVARKLRCPIAQSVRQRWKKSLP